MQKTHSENKKNPGSAFSAARISKKPFLKKSVLAAIAAVLFLMPQLLHAQDLILISYQRNFMRVSLSAKTGVLLDAANDDRADEFMGDLYEFALKYVLENGELLQGDADMISLAITAARGAGRTGHTASIETLWSIFLIFQDSHTRVEILHALEILGENGGPIIENLNQFLLERSEAFHSGTAFSDYQVLEAVIAALSSRGDDSSYPALFSTADSFYPLLFREICRALEKIPGGLKEFLSEYIRNGSVSEKLTAFRIAQENSVFSPSDKGDIAELALGYSLMLLSQDETAILLRREAVKTLTALKWTRASPLAIQHFQISRGEFNSGAVSREYVVEAIECLSAMGDFESSQTLALQLGQFNSETERGSIYDEGIMLALIRSLGETGDKTAFDYLLYVSYLNYSERIKTAAREALNHLRW